MQTKTINPGILAADFCQDFEESFTPKTIAIYEAYEPVLTRAVEVMKLVPSLQEAGIRHGMLPAGKLTWIRLLAMAYDQMYISNYYVAQKEILSDVRLFETSRHFLVDLSTLTHHILLKCATPEMESNLDKYMKEPGLGAP